MMSILRYLQPVSRLLDSKGLLSSAVHVPSPVIAEANRQVQQAASNKKQKHASNPIVSVCTEIGS